MLPQDMWLGPTGQVEFGEQPTYQTTFTADEPPTVAITRAIAVIEGVDPTGLPRLFDNVGSEELDAILGVPSKNIGGEPTVIKFSTLGYQVRAIDDGRITIQTTVDSNSETQ